MATFSPSMKPASFKPWWNARRRAGSGDEGWRSPITGIAGCCARAANGTAAAAPPRSDMNSRRCMCPENTPYAIVVVNILGPRHAPRRQEIYLVRGRAAHHFLHIAEIVRLVE